MQPLLALSVVVFAYAYPPPMSLLIQIYNAQGETVADAELHLHQESQGPLLIMFDAERNVYALEYDGQTPAEIKARHPAYEIDPLVLPLRGTVGGVSLSAGVRGDAYTVMVGRRCFYRVLEGHLGAVPAVLRPSTPNLLADLRALEVEMDLQRVPFPETTAAVLDADGDPREQYAYRLGKNSPSIASVLQRLRASGLYQGVGELRADGSIHLPEVRIVTEQAGLDWLRAQNFDPEPCSEDIATHCFTLSTGQEVKSDTLWKKMARSGLFESFWQVPL